MAAVYYGCMLLIISSCFQLSGASAIKKPERVYTADEVPSLLYTMTPVNAAVVVGSSAQFTCETYSPKLDWWFQPAEGGPFIPIVDECKVNPAYIDRYRLANVYPGRCDVVVISVSLSDAGVFGCQAGFNATVTAGLAVIYSQPVCTMGNMEPVEGSEVTITCEVQYTPNLSAMKMTWTDANLLAMTPQEEISQGHTKSWIVVPANPPRLSSYLCTTNFTEPSGLPLFATNAPSYKTVWNSLNLDVLHCPSSLTITSPSTVIFVGDVVTCSSDGFPTPQYEWENVVSEEKFSEPTLIINETDSTYKCTARSVINENTCTPLQSGNVKAFDLVRPENQAKVAGEKKVELKCRQRNQDIIWLFAPTGSSSSVTIVVNCSPVEGFNNKYSVDKQDSSCNLVIHDVTSSQAGTYTCQDYRSTARPVSAQLVILESSPVCSSDETENYVLSGQPVNYHCKVNYRGNLSPKMIWVDTTTPEKVHKNVVVKQEETFVESSLTINAEKPSLGPFTSRTYFDGPESNPSDHVDEATNAPLYTYSWTSTQLLVLDAEVAGHDCQSLHEQIPSLPSGVYSVFIPSLGKAVQVYCDMSTTGGGWTVIQRRIDGSERFRRSWLDYTTGFGTLKREFWIGNDNIAALTASGTHTLRIDLGDWAGNFRYAEYEKFKVSPESDKYRISIGDYAGDAGDSLVTHNGQMFSAVDQNNNDGGLDCSCRYRGVWWYSRNCGYSNLNGEYNNTRGGEGVNWADWKGFEYSLKFTEMKIRAV